MWLSLRIEDQQGKKNLDVRKKYINVFFKYSVYQTTNISVDSHIFFSPLLLRTVIVKVNPHYSQVFLLRLVPFTLPYQSLALRLLLSAYKQIPLSPIWIWLILGPKCSCSCANISPIIQSKPLRSLVWYHIFFNLFITI